MVYAKPPFGGPAAVLAYLARYTHRVAIANSRLVSLDDHAVRFRGKDYRTADPATGAVKIRTMALSPGEFLRRFLLHVLPSGRREDGQSTTRAAANIEYVVGARTRRRAR